MARLKKFAVNEFVIILTRVRFKMFSSCEEVYCAMLINMLLLRELFRIAAFLQPQKSITPHLSFYFFTGTIVVHK